MMYMKVKWKHSDPQYPTLTYSELDHDRWEVRKVEIYADGRRDYASKRKATGSTDLSLTSIPPLTEIAMDPQFEPVEIRKEEFEEVWRGTLAVSGQ
jgi:hypothetical protein